MKCPVFKTIVQGRRWFVVVNGTRVDVNTEGWVRVTKTRQEVVYDG